MKNEGTWTFFLCHGSSGGSFYSEVLGALHTYTTAKNRTIRAESTVFDDPYGSANEKSFLYTTRIATVSPALGNTSRFCA